MNLKDEGRPQSEVEAIALVQEVGLDEVQRRFDALSTQAQSRFDAYAADGRIPLGFTAFNCFTESELTERHLLLLGLMLCSDEQGKARERIAARRKLRKLDKRARVGIHEAQSHG